MCILGAKYILVHVLLLKFHLSDLHNFHILDILGMLPYCLEYVYRIRPQVGSMPKITLA
jgi:hypothetical protein